MAYSTNFIKLFATANFQMVCLASCLFVTLSGCSETQDKPKETLLGHHHATWTRSLFFRGYAETTGDPLTPADLEEFATTLKVNNIEYAYIFSGPYGEDGFLPDWAFSELAISSVREIKKFHPKIKILPWVGGIDGRTVHFDRDVWRENALASTKKLVETLQVEGVHFDFERLQSPDVYNEDGVMVGPDLDGKKYARGLLQFQKEIRARMPDLFVSSVVVATAKDTRPWKRKHTMDELKELFGLVDQISFLYYDTSIKENEVFKRNMIEQLETIKKLQTVTPSHPQVLIAIGTFLNPEYLRKYRDLSIENIPNTLKVLKESLKLVLSATPLVDGLAIYCEWQTDAEEWEEIRDHR